jgi:two-component sensor histidine kinase
LDVRWVSLSEYISSLIHDLQDVSATGHGGGSAITFQSDQIQAGPDSAVAVGIVATELILNALKHAYPDGRGAVRVYLKASGTSVKLIVEDDGVGCDGEMGTDRRRGLGQRIMSGMADKLDGALSYDSLKPGTRAVLTFPMKDDVRISFKSAPGTNQAA